MAGTLDVRINTELKAAIKAQNKRRVSTLRLIMAAFKDRIIQNRGTGKDEGLTAAGMQEILAKMVKQRRETAETYDKGGRPELAQAEREEITIIEEFQPRQLSDDEVKGAVAAVVHEIGATGLKDMGRVMAALKERHAGQMDFAKAGAMVKGLLVG